MAAMRFVFLLGSLIVQTSISKDLEASESHRRLLTCPNPSGFFLAGTLDVQTYYPSYCSTSAISEVGGFLFDHFKTFSAYDTTVGAIEVVPTRQTATTCTGGRRHLFETSDGIEDEETSSSMHRELSTTILGFFFKMPVQCKLCPPDNADGRRRLANTSPITIRVKTDKYPAEFSYRVRVTNIFGNAGDALYKSSGIVSPETEYIQTLYLEPNTKYFVTLKDLFGDGICCDFGSGSFQISTGTNMNGSTLLYDRGNFGSSRTLSFVTPPTPTTVVASSSLIDIGQLQLKYSEYLTYYLQQSYHNDQTKCLYGTFPTVNVILKETTYADAIAPC